MTIQDRTVVTDMTPWMKRQRYDEWDSWAEYVATTKDDQSKVDMLLGEALLKGTLNESVMDDLAVPAATREHLRGLPGKNIVELAQSIVASQ